MGRNCKARRKSPGTTMETLIPDFEGIKTVQFIDIAPEIVSHNIETVNRLTRC